ncbi:ClpP/crotonase-like domain-containing protein [Aspergillus karnatakaensis]|uniref:ClpP/crotonase-like domain-containing protein n=1 Tax=Aspergillus karnatakaensis TaxID=1810916 RepID=UPI003CCDE73E
MTAASILTSITRSTRASRPIATVTVCRPSKLNSLNSYLLNTLTDEMRSLPEKHLDLLAVVLTGAGPKSFIGGADIAEMATLSTSTAAREFITRVHKACQSIRDCPVPVIGRINGYALGAGLEIAASCDFRVASRNAVFGMPEVNVGIPSVVEAALLPGLIGWGRTRRFLMLGDNIPAAEALQWGLVEKAVEPEHLDHAVDEWIQLLEKSGSCAVRQQKRLIRQWEQLGLDAGIQAGISVFGESFERNAEGPQMMSAFFKRKEERR